MIKYFCDVCGKEVEYESRLHTIIVEGQFIKKDICGNCVNALNKWLQHEYKMVRILIPCDTNASDK